jgi:hypothetical protein
MKVLFFAVVFMMSVAWAKAPANPDSFTCPKKTKKSVETKPVLLHQVNEKHILGLCGVKESQNGNYSDFDIFVYPETKKPIFSNHFKDRRFLVMEKKDGMLFIEKVKVDKEFVELFKNEIACTEEKCSLEKEACIAINKVKQQWIFKNAKDAKVKKRMKKLGCV